MSSQEEHSAFLVLATLDEVPEPIDTSTRIVADCGCECWIAATGRALLANPFVRARTGCLRHAMADPKARREVIENGVTAVPGARQALTRQLGPELVDRIYSTFGIRPGPLGDTPEWN